MEGSDPNLPRSEPPCGGSPNISRRTATFCPALVSMRPSAGAEACIDQTKGTGSDFLITLTLAQIVEPAIQFPRSESCRTAYPLLTHMSVLDMAFREQFHFCVVASRLGTLLRTKSGDAWRRRAWWRASAAIVALAIGVTVHAAETSAKDLEADVIESVTPELLLEILRQEGYAATTDSDGNVVWRLDGYRTLLLAGGGSSSIIRFFSAFNSDDTTLEHVNEWNKTKFFSSSYLSDDGKPVLELHLDLDGGVTIRRIVDFLGTCHRSFSRWVSEVVQ